jgi:hypothetical protein
MRLHRYLAAINYPARPTPRTFEVTSITRPAALFGVLEWCG